MCAEISPHVPSLRLRGLRHWGEAKRLTSALLALSATLCAEPPAAVPPYRTDGGDENLPWYQLKAGEFPPTDAAHRIDITLLTIDPPARGGRYRTQAQVDYYKPKIASFSVLPGASVRRHDAPADLRDYAFGAHVTIGAFQDADRQAFTQVWTLTDQFSLDAANGIRWRVQAVDAGRGAATLARVTGGQEEKPRAVIFDARTTFWKGAGFGSAADFAQGQEVLVNFGPGTAALPARELLTDVWLDEESRAAATARQSARSLFELRRRGMPVRVDAVNNQDPELTLTFLDTGFPNLLGRFVTGNSVQISVADSALRTYEPAGGQGGPDSFSGKITSHRELPPQTGSAGWQIVVKPKYLLEGFRPGRHLRLMDDRSHFQILPPEERQL